MRSRTTSPRSSPCRTTTICCTGKKNARCSRSSRFATDPPPMTRGSFVFIVSISVLGASRGVPWLEVWSLDPGKRPARARKPMGTFSEYERVPEPHLSQPWGWILQRKQWVCGDRRTVRNSILGFVFGRVLTPPVSALRSWPRRRG